MPFTNSNTLAQLQLDEGEKSRPTKGIDMTQNTVPGGHVHQFRAGEVGCTGCLEHRQDCDCWRCNRKIALVMPDTLTSDQRREINARMAATFEVHVAEMVRRNKAEGVTR